MDVYIDFQYKITDRSANFFLFMLKERKKKQILYSVLQLSPMNITSYV